MSRIFGKVCQNGYVVRDIEAALAHWTRALGVGPFFYIERVPLEWFRYHGAPSMYRDFLRAGHEGLQHVACWTTSYGADLDRLLAQGYRIGQEGQIGGPQGRFVYFETEAHPGTVIELSDTSGAKGAFFAQIRKAAAEWDGADPIRVIRPSPSRC